jgi:predicted cupin superfamily sugar epimerase
MVTDYLAGEPARARELIEQLQLMPHPERGYYVETYRAPVSVHAQPAGGVAQGGPRAASTAIYYLVTSAEPSSRLHRLRSDELFHLYEGGPLEVLLLTAGQAPAVRRLGLDLGAGERPQLIIPAGTWFGTELGPGASHCLIGCTVAPGFDFADFELAEGNELAEQFPAAAERIRRMLG